MSRWQHMQETLHLGAGRLRSVTISGHKFKNIPAYERSGKGIPIVFKECQDSLPQDEGSIGFKKIHDIVKLLTMHGK